jgi:2'-5' RNA ligase
VWLTTPKTPEPLVRLAAFLNGALESCGHEPDPRAFRPHVTIARDVRRFRGTPAIAAIDWRVRDYCLVESILTARGSDYAVRRRWPLRREVQTGNGKY